MSALIHDDFLLQTRTARRLYHEHAAPLPIIDYHSHVSPQDLAQDRVFPNLTALWIAPDQYKHRAMRMLGMPEEAITGNAAPGEKFRQWAAALPQTAGNPLYHWSALELRRYFGITQLLAPATATAVWESANAQLAQPSHRARALLASARVEFLCTSDRLLDDLEAHAALAASAFPVRVVPSLRADDALAVDSPDFRPWLDQLEQSVGFAIDSLEAFEATLLRRLDVFAQRGCCVADHGIDVLAYSPVTYDEACQLFASRLSGTAFDAADAVRLRSHLLTFLGRAYAERGWVLQLHLGAHRHTSTRLRRIAGPAGGFATIGATTDVAMLSAFLDDLEKAGRLPRTILYSLNPADYAALATLTGSFAEDGVAGKLQLGPAWWFNDHHLGIRQQLEAITHYGLLSTFVGMTTDSRSLLSMSRHEYFRRIFCDYLGGLAESGLLPLDDSLLGDCVRRACYENARRWFASSTTPSS